MKNVNKCLFSDIEENCVAIINLLHEDIDLNELIEKIAYCLREETKLVSDLIINNNLSNEQFAISWNDSLNEISIRF